MILNDLLAYYELKADGDASDIPRQNWSREKVAWEFRIDAGGKLLGIVSYADDSAKVKSRSLNVPEHVTRSSGVRAYFLCDKAAYFLGRDAKRGEEMLARSRELHHEILDKLDDPAGKAVLSFLDNHQGVGGITEEQLEKLDGGENIVFRYVPDGGYVHDREAIKRAWGEYCAGKAAGERVRCAVTGELAPPAKLFPLVKGLPGAQSSGASLVSFNLESFCSYGKSKGDQALNASLSESAAFGIGSALKYLVQSREHRVGIGNTQFIFWTDSVDDEEGGLFSSMFDFDSNREDEEKVEELRAKLVGIREGKVTSGYHRDTNFYLLGLAPNAARIAIRFFEEGTLGEYEKNLERYLQDTKMVDAKSSADGCLPPRSYRFFAYQVAALGKADNLPESVLNQLMRAFVFGRAFPYAYYQLLIQRMRVDKGLSGVGERKRDVAGYRAAIIKACLIRMGKIESGGRWVELNESPDIGYRLGRLFALLERVQTAAVPGATSTIRDRYMGAAAATPARVFPQLMGLSQKHITKIGKDKPGLQRWFDDRIGEVLNDGGSGSVESFPPTLDYEQQGLFYIGYYHQRAAKYKSDVETAESKEEIGNE